MSQYTWSVPVENSQFNVVFPTQNTDMLDQTFDNVNALQMTAVSIVSTEISDVIVTVLNHGSIINQIISYRDSWLPFGDSYILTLENTVNNIDLQRNISTISFLISYYTAPVPIASTSLSKSQSSTASIQFINGLQRAIVGANKLS